MNPFEMVVLIVAITAIASIYRAKHASRRHASSEEQQAVSAENERLHHDVKALKERVAVLERIATDKNHLLEQEIERLRDR